MICDVHAHCLPNAVEDHIRAKLRTGPRISYGDRRPPDTDSPDDLARRIEIMDEAGVQVQVLSLNPVHMLDDEATTVAVVRKANDALAAAVDRYPDRFLAYVELPMPYLQSSLTELARCRDEYGMRAVNLLASSGNESAVAERFDPLYEELDWLGSIVFFHPRISGLCAPLINDFELATPLGPLFEDTLIVAQMVRRRFVARFPNLKVIIPHLGGLLPIYLERMDNQMGSMFAELDERPSATVRRFWFDTLVHGSVAALRSACQSFGADRLVTGSDFPVMEHHDGYRASIEYIRHAGLSDAEVEQILHVNAPALFGLHDDSRAFGR